ncbi:bacillithiol biosynthesis deacetylase BshB2 [Metabacillus fastidiosus]|uniref:bacillithiol biosynthesis deacetylase BshB2 n=1 Tax=Metabacillus fastidiosus TaxID=1458 RepID=UPI002E1B42D3|nr:bacillithiol biosynthesis deacetylase BshB2 [Metabacillus fastidiosus]
MNEHILIALPHPDDESFGAAGLIALSRQKGIPVTYACGTLGEMGRNMGSPLFANRETLPGIRKRELEDACEALDIQDLRMLGLRDKTLEFEDEEHLANIIEKIVNDIKPSLVVTFYPGYGVHPDHDAFGAAVIRALKRKPISERPVTYGIAISSNRIEEIGEPDVGINIISVADVKLKALKAHRSQTEGMLKQMEEGLLKNNPMMMEWFEKEYFWTYKWSD